MRHPRRQLTRSPAMLPRTSALSLLPLLLRPPGPLGRQEERRSTLPPPTPPSQHKLLLSSHKGSHSTGVAHYKVAEICPVFFFFFEENQNLYPYSAGSRERRSLGMSLKVSLSMFLKVAIQVFVLLLPTWYHGCGFAVFVFDVVAVVAYIVVTFVVFVGAGDAAADRKGFGEVGERNFTSKLLCSYISKFDNILDFLNATHETYIQAHSRRSRLSHARSSSSRRE